VVMPCGCCVVLLDVSSESWLKGNYGCGIVAYDCCMLGREVLRVFRVLRILSDQYAENVCTCSTRGFEAFVDALLWGFSWKNHKYFEPSIRRSILESLDKSSLIIMASKSKFGHAADLLLDKLSQCTSLILVTDSGREEVRCVNRLSSRAEKMGFHVSKHAKYTPFLMIADYVAGLARYAILWKLLAREMQLRDYRDYRAAYNRLHKWLKGKVYEFT